MTEPLDILIPLLLRVWGRGRGCVYPASPNSQYLCRRGGERDGEKKSTPQSVSSGWVKSSIHAACILPTSSLGPTLPHQTYRLPLPPTGLLLSHSRPAPPLSRVPPGGELVKNSPAAKSKGRYPGSAISVRSPTALPRLHPYPYIA